MTRGTSQAFPAIKAALLAGLVAGLVAAAFHSFLTEPIIEEAIEIEERLEKAKGGPAGEPVVSRAAQRVGLIFGFLLYGGAWGIIFGLLWKYLRGYFAGWSDTKLALFFAASLCWTVSLFPFLKYPANPPGVGDPETIGYRQALYLGYTVLSILGIFLAVAIKRFLKPETPGAGYAWPMVLNFYAIYLILLIVAFPENPDPNPMPPELVWNFRALSFIGLVVFWGVLGATFAWRYREITRES